MSLRLNMLDMAKRGSKLLPEPETPVVDFVRSCFSNSGGACDRSGRSDIYYTVFAIQCLRALGQQPLAKSIRDYLLTFKSGENLDLVHLACLARCWAEVIDEINECPVADEIIANLAAHRSPDGGFAMDIHSVSGSVYNCFLALGAYQDLGRELPDPSAMLKCVSNLRTSDGSYSNDTAIPIGSVPATSAAAMIYDSLGEPFPTETCEWMISCSQSSGGFVAMPLAPQPDLLSTATALHALSTNSFAIDSIAKPCTAYVRSLFTGRGFRGHADDPTDDCEYTFYGLLALGHLASLS